MKGEQMQITFFPTTSCNVGCSHCLDDANTANPTHIPLEYLKLANEKLEADKWYVEYVATGNGEPLLHPQFNELVDTLFSYRRCKELQLLTAGYTVQEVKKRKSFMELLGRDYLRRVSILLSFNLYADFPERWSAVLGDVSHVSRDFGMTANICFDRTNFKETIESFDGIFKKFALGNDVSENFYNLIMYPENSFCINHPSAAYFEMDVSSCKEEMLLPKSFTYFILGKYVDQYISTLYSQVFKKGRGIKLAGGFDCDGCTDLFRDFNASIHLNPDGYWYLNSRCPKTAKMRLGHVTDKTGITVLLRRKYLFCGILTRLLLRDSRMYNAKKPCSICQMICNEYGVMEHVLKTVK